MNVYKPIAISLSPNTETDDIYLALKLLFQVGIWKKGGSVKKIEKSFKDYLKVKYVFSFNSGRSALFAILAGMGVKKGDEVLLQAFTCNAAANPILELGAKPIFIDIDKDLNLNPENLERKISSRARVVIIQHTFGNPARIDEIKKICQRRNLFLIEDCAHAIGARYKGKLCGTFGDAAFFSLGRDKIISSVYGGIAVTNNHQISQKIKNIRESFLLPSNGWILQQVLHPIIFFLALPIFSFFNIGKVILYLCQKLKVLSPSVYKEEKKGKMSKCFPMKMPNAMAVLALNQFKKLERFGKHRKKIAEIYNQNFTEEQRQDLMKENASPVFMRYPIFIKNAKEVREKLKKQNILLDDGWHTLPIVPPGTNLSKMYYQKGSCPRAENIAKAILNLPTSINISSQKAEKIIQNIQNIQI